MLAPRELPADYARWNREHGAPNGHARARRRGVRRLARRDPRIGGPFAHQVNNTTRAFEYPWAYHAAPIGGTVVDIGGSLAGFQFVLAREGCTVFNVDPGEESTGRGWPVNPASIARLNRAFHTDVTLIPSTLEGARIATGSVDTVYSISTIEHIAPGELPAMAREIARVLRPGGRCVLTVDLFLNLRPFTPRDVNEFGTNVSVHDLVEASGLDLVTGLRCELYGYPEFDPQRILATVETRLIGSYPALAQCLVLEKRE